MRIFKSFIIIILFLTMISLVLAVCTDLGTITTINKNMDLCEKEYFIEDGINILKDNITIDCNNAKLKGNNLTYALAVHNKNSILIKNCVFENFKTAIDIINSENIKISSSTFQLNGIAVKAHNARLEETNSTFANNNENIKYSYECFTGDNYCPEECAYETDEDCKPISTKSDAEVKEIKEGSEVQKEDIKELEPEKEEIQNDIQADKIVPIRISDHQRASQLIELTKTMEIKEDKTFYEIKIRALNDIKGLVLYEYFPKEIVENADEVNFKDAQIVKKDPVLKKNIGEMKKDEVVVITYDLNKIIKGDTNPSSVVTIENNSKIISLLANISYILAIYLVVVLIKRYKADKMLKKFRQKTKKLLGAPFPITYLVLLIVPYTNYKLLLSERIAIVFFITAIIIFLLIIFYLIKRGSK